MENANFLRTLDPEMRGTWESILEKALRAVQVATGLARKEVEGIALREAMEEFAKIAEYKDGKWVERKSPRAA
jgi:hypothetical protein